MKIGLVFTGLCLSSTSLCAQWVINEGFEQASLPSGWTTVDANNDGETWISLQHANAHSGNRMAFVQSYNNNGNDWLITPQIAVGQNFVFSFYARAWAITEKMYVMLSTSGNAVNNFTTTLASVTDLGNSYQEFTYDLSAYSGQNIYLAIHWVQDTYAMMVDEVKVGTPPLSDMGMISILRPRTIELLGDTLTPSGVIKNFSEIDINTPFEVSCSIRDSTANLVYSNTYNYSGSLSPAQTDTIVFNTWIPQGEGDYQVTIKVSLDNDGNNTNDSIVKQTRIAAHQGTGGPDTMGYYWIDNTVENGPAFNWIDISSTGSSTVMHGVNQFYGDDNFSEAIPIGFPFPFYGIERNSFFVDINGELLLSENNWVKPFPTNGWNNDGNPFNYVHSIPGYSEMPALISVFWDDLFADQGIGDVLYQTMGTAPERYCVIQWNNVRFVAGTGGSPTLCFQVILHENGDIVMQYLTVDNGQTGGSNPHNNGQSATIGIQNDDATSGLVYLNEIVSSGQYLGYFPEGNLIQNNTAIKFYLGEDYFPPAIAHKKVWNTFENYMEITANITDVSNILYDTLYYNYGSGWLPTTHCSITEPNEFHYLIEDIPAGSTVFYYFTAVDGSTNANRAVLDSIGGLPLTFKTLPTENTSVLLLMPGNTVGFQDYQNREFPKFKMALDSLHVNYDIFNWAAYDSYRFSDCYDILITYSNTTGISAIHDTLSAAIIDFLDRGTISAPKNIFLASDDFASAQHGLPNHRKMKRFFTAYVRGGYNVQPNPPIYGGDNGIGGPDYFGYANGSIIGLAGTPVGMGGVEINVYADDPDVIVTGNCPEWYAQEVSNPEISSNYSFAFKDGPINGNAYSHGNGCAIWLDNLIYKSFFISFDISQFTDDDDIIGMISDAIDWFTPEIFTVSVAVSPQESGFVTGAGNYPNGATATLAATAATGYAFTNWTENGNVVSTSTIYTFAVTGNRSLVANFQAQPQIYTITVSANPTNGGTVTGGGTYNQGQSCTVTATANTGFNFTNWTENGSVVSTNASYTFNVTSNRNLVANFTAQPQTYTITVSANPTNGGTVTGGGTYNQGQSCTVTATPASGYTFLRWTENGNQVSTNASYTFTVNANRNLIANFQAQPQTYTITVSANPTNGGTVTGGGTYNQGQSCTVTATANTGYAFTNWTENGNVVSTEQSYMFTVTGNRNLVANFVSLMIKITGAVEPEEAATLTGAGNYTYGDEVTLTLERNEDWAFQNWTENGEVVCETMTYTFIATENRDLVAHFIYTESVGEQNGIETMIYPNPVNDKMTIEANEALGTVEIYNLMGALVYSQNDCANKVEINTDGLPSGIYFVRLTTNRAKVSRRFVKE